MATFSLRIALIMAAALLVAPPLSTVVQADDDLQKEHLEEAPLGNVWPDMSEPRLGDLDALVEHGEIRVLTTFTLGSYFIDNGVQQGTVYELTRILETYARATIGADAKRLKVTIIPVRRDQLLPNLVAGYGDVVFANQTVTAGRSAVVDFAYPVARNIRELLVTAPGAPPVNSIEDLAGKEVTVPVSSSYFESLVALNQRFMAEGLEPVDIRISDPRLEIDDIIQMLNADLISMTVADEHRMLTWSKVFPNVKVHEDIVLRENGAVALALRKESPQLKALLDGFSRENRLGTLTANMLMTKYTEYVGWTKSALAGNLSERLQELAGLFQTYGEQYDIDWLLLASFAYQESGFNQSVRSPVGAIGVMQVMPSTAADRSINIDNIEEVENNVHAGTKYLALLRSHYFSDEDLDEGERMLFTMAGYNAGPNRINRLRREAESRGLDPNVWFNNVELIVAAKVGREPINYVGNIYRYYIAYKRLQTIESEE